MILYLLPYPKDQRNEYRATIYRLTLLRVPRVYYDPCLENIPRSKLSSAINVFYPLVALEIKKKEFQRIRRDSRFKEYTVELSTVY